MEVEPNRNNMTNHQHDREKSVKEMLACPVCSKLPVAPVYGCQNGHLICENCKGNVQHCSVCRAERFNVRCLLAEELLETKILECENKDSGCFQNCMTGPEFTLHVQNCGYRSIECECKSGISECRNELIPYNKYLEHLTEFHAALPALNSSFVVSCNITGIFTPRLFQCFDRQFVLMSQRNQTRFWTWVAYMDRQEEPAGSCYLKIKLRIKTPNEPGMQYFPSDVITPCSVRTVPEDVLKSGQCLEFSASTVPTSAPPCVWPQYEPEEGEETSEWGYDVEIWEQRKSATSSNNKKIAQSPSPTSGRRLIISGPSTSSPVSSSSRQINFPAPPPASNILRTTMAGTSPHNRCPPRPSVLHNLLLKPRAPRPRRDSVAGGGDQGEAAAEDSDGSSAGNNNDADEEDDDDGVHEEEGQESQSESERMGSRRGSNDTTSSRDSPESKVSQSQRHCGRRRSTPSGASDSGENDGAEGEPGQKRKKYEPLVDSESSGDEDENKDTESGSSRLIPTSSTMPARDPQEVPQQQQQQRGSDGGATSPARGGNSRGNEIASPDPSPDSVNNPPTPEPVYCRNTSGPET